MRSCQALFGGKSCQELGDEYGYCHKHLRQERTLYNYYKSQECRWKEAKFEAQREHGHTDKFFQAHQYITTAICARRLHGKIFYPGDECSGHLQYILQLESEKFAVEWKVFEEGLGLVYQNEKIEEGLENALTKLDLECSDGKLRLADLFSSEHC
ncbi:hypothetical protein GGR54DRAFT_82456 [Hypoxylon sp. NC1633]|nr:hypothetical protein GGR54DRAFT_82456 [Hypoxylon sp. NC1633]